MTEASNFKIPCLKLRFQVVGLRAQGSGSRVQGFWFRFSEGEFGRE
jgi:hypothetical protein